MKPKVRPCGSQKFPFYDGTTGAADEEADADHDGGHEETRAGARPNCYNLRQDHKKELRVHKAQSLSKDREARCRLVWVRGLENKILEIYAAKKRREELVERSRGGNESG